MRSFADSPVDPQQSGLVEQRLFLRKRVSTPLPIELFPGKEVWLDDLGEGGLSVSGSSRLEPGATTFLLFEFPAANAIIEASGVIAWCEAGGRAGVRFTRIKPDSTAALKRWLKSGEAETRKIDGTSGSERLERGTPGVQRNIAKLLAEIVASKLSYRQALDIIAERMLALTRAAGSAIACGPEGDVICEASFGNAPAVGTRLDLNSTLSGECYRTGNIVSLSDAENDSRVNLQRCRQLGFRSLLIVPIRFEEEVIGIAEVFSTAPGNFDGGDILLLGSLAEFVGQFYGRNQGLDRSPTHPS